MISDTLTVSRADFEARYRVGAQAGGCMQRRDLYPDERSARRRCNRPVIDRRQLNLPLVHDEAHNLWALGPESIGSRALSTVAAPNLTLPTLDGETFELHSLRGKKGVLVAWSPY